MTSPVPDPSQHTWGRLLPVLPYAMLALATVVAVVTQPSLDAPAGETTTMLVLSGVTACWIWFWTTAHPQWQHHTGRMAIYYTVRTVLAFALTWINPFYALFAFVGYIDVLEFFRFRHGVFGVAATAISMAGSQSGGFPLEGRVEWSIFAALYLVNVTLAGGFGYVSVRESEVSDARADVITELERANTRLEASLEENAALQRQLVEQAREAGVDDERQRLAREIHDTIAQGLAGIVTQLRAATEATDDEAAREHVDRAAALARDSLDDARRSVQDLSPSELDQTALPHALTELLRGWADSSEVAAELTVTGTEIRLHNEIETTLLRIVQEGLTNVRKHAGARRVGVTLSYMGDEVSVDVRDDGCGFGHNGTNGRDAYGLRVMRERAERIAGTLDVESEPGGGTAISARVPSVTLHD